MSDQPGLLGRIDRSGVPMLVCRLVIGGLFIRMGLVKAMDPVGFLKLIREYEMFPDNVWWLLNFTVATLPWIEVLSGYLLILGIGLRGNGTLILFMLAVFTPMIFLRGMAIHGEQQISFCRIYFDCGCGAGVVNVCWKLAENIALFGGALYILLSRSTRFALRAKLLP